MHPTFHIEYELVSIKYLCLVVLYLTLQIHLCLVVIIPYTSTPQIHLCLVVLHLTLHIQLCLYTSSCKYDCVFTHHLNPIVSSRAQPIFNRIIRTCRYAEVRLTRLFQTIQPLLRKRSAQEATYLIVSFVQTSSPRTA